MKYSLKITLALSAFVFAACSSSDGFDPEERPPVPASGQLQLLHASPDAPTVNIEVDGTAVANGVDYGQSSIELNLEAGSHTVEVFAVFDTGATSCLTQDVTVVADTVTTVAVVGAVDCPLDPMTNLAIVSKADVTPDAGMARVVVLHGTDGAGGLPVDIYVDAFMEPEVPVGTSTPIQLAFGESTVDPISLMPGDYQIRVTLRDSLVPVYDSGSVPVAAGDDVTVVAVPNVSGGGAAVSLLAVTAGGSFGAGAGGTLLDADTPTGLRVGHLSPDTGPVDIVVNGGVLYDNVPYGVVTPIVALEAGDYTVSITDGDDPMTVFLEDTDLTLDPGVAYDALAIGLSMNEEGDEAEDFTVSILTPDIRPYGAGISRVRIIHASPSADNVDIYLLDPALMGDLTGQDPTLADVAFGTVTDHLSVAAGDYDVIVTPAGDPTVIAINEPITVLPGLVATAIAIDGDPFDLLVLLDVLGDT